MTFPDVTCDARPACMNRAVHVVSIHTVHDCEAVDIPWLVERWTPTGDTVWLTCSTDMLWIAGRLNVLVKSMYRLVGCDGVPHCATCNRPIRDVYDMMKVEDM